MPFTVPRDPLIPFTLEMPNQGHKHATSQIQQWVILPKELLEFNINEFEAETSVVIQSNFNAATFQNHAE